MLKPNNCTLNTCCTITYRVIYINEMKQSLDFILGPVYVIQRTESNSGDNPSDWLRFIVGIVTQVGSARRPPAGFYYKLFAIQLNLI